MPFDLMILYNLTVWRAATGQFGPTVQVLALLGIVLGFCVVGWLAARSLARKSRR